VNVKRGKNMIRLFLDISVNHEEGLPKALLNLLFTLPTVSHFNSTDRYTLKTLKVKLEESKFTPK